MTNNNQDFDNCEYQNYLFQELTPEELALVAKNKREVFYKKGEIICEEGKPINELLYLKSGLVKLFKSSPGNRDQIISLAKPMDCVGLLTVFHGINYKFSLSALEDSVIFSVDMSLINKFIFQNSIFSCSLLRKMSKLADEIIQHNLELNQRHLRGRIAHILLDFINDIYKTHSFDLPISRKEMGEIIGMTTENVIRILSEFRKDNIIEINGKNITIKDIKRLEKISEHG